MPIVEALLTYRPSGYGQDLPPVPLGATADRRVLRLVRDVILNTAWDGARHWKAIDPGVYAVHLAEAERLRRILDLLIPDEELRGDLRLVPRS